MRLARPPWLLALAFGCSFSATGSGMTSEGEATSEGSTSTTTTTSSTTSTAGSDTTTSTSTTTTSSSSATADPTSGGSTTSDGTTGAELGPFGPPVAIDAINELLSAEDDPCLSNDELELYFNSNRLGNGDIYVSRRNSTVEAWPTPTRVDELSTGDEEGTPRLSPDNLAILFNRDPPGSGGNNIFIATRPDTDSAWSNVQSFSDLDSSDSDLCATPVADTDRVLLCSGRGPSQSLDVWEGTIDLANRTASGIGIVAELSGDGEDCCAYGVDTGLTVYYYAQLPGSVDGSADLYIARRPDLDSEFTVEPIAELNTGEFEADPWVTADQRTLYFTRADDIYYATR